MLYFYNFKHLLLCLLFLDPFFVQHYTKDLRKLQHSKITRIRICACKNFMHDWELILISFKSEQ